MRRIVHHPHLAELTAAAGATVSPALPAWLCSTIRTLHRTGVALATLATLAPLQGLAPAEWKAVPKPRRLTHAQGGESIQPFQSRVIQVKQYLNPLLFIPLWASLHSSDKFHSLTLLSWFLIFDLLTPLSALQSGMAGGYF